MGRILAAIAKMNAHYRLGISLLAAVVIGLFIRHSPLWVATLTDFDVFALVGLVLLWVTIFFTPRQRIRQIAKNQDVGATLIFVFAIAAASAAILSVIFLARDADAESRKHFHVHVVLTIATVVLSWLYTHTVFGLRYAHRYYGDSDESSQQHAGGLDFPGDRKPDYSDFAYFSFVIGMTCQVSDVQVTSRDLRRLVLAHGILSFAFNTAILAFTLNTVSDLLKH